MRPTRRLTLAALLLAALPFTVTPALADPGEMMGGPGGGGPGARLERKLDKLGLSESQHAKVQAILDAAKPKREEIRGRMRQAFQDMRALLDQDQPSQDAVLAQADRIGQISTEAHKSLLTTLLQVRAELTPEQRAKLKESMREGMHGRWHHKMHGDSGSGAPEPPAPEN